jgi:hypothetical protein
MRSRLVVSSLLLAASAGLTGCGALFNSGPAHVAFQSNPAGAEVWINGTNRGVTPITLDLAKKENYTVTFRKAGFQDATVALSHKVGAGWVILDVLGGVLPVVIDAATGSWYSLTSNNVNVNLTQATAMHGQLTPEQLAAVRLGARIDNFVQLPTPSVAH